MIKVFDPSSSVAQKLLQMEAAQPARQPLLAAESKREMESAQPVPSETVLFAGQAVEVWNDENFSRLRRCHGVPDDFLNGNRDNRIDLNHAREESKLGKGGERQYISHDSKFIVKSVSGADHKSLLVLAQAYVDRLITGRSLLVPIYCHFRDPRTQKIYIAMQNLTSPEIPWDEKYDLKGCADDKTVMRRGELIEPVHKRFYRVDLWCRCMWDGKRHRYYDGKVKARALHFDLPVSHRDELVELIEGDAEWLVGQGLMDYSLFLAVHRCPGKQRRELPESNDNSAGAVRHWAFQDEGEDVLVTASIIDFLQPWNASKKVAQCIKFLEFNKATIPPEPYGARFKAHFAQRLRGVDRLKPLCPADSVAQKPRRSDLGLCYFFLALLVVLFSYHGLS